MSKTEYLVREIEANPTIMVPLLDLLTFMADRNWGDFQLTVKNGKVVHYYKSISCPVIEQPTSPSEDRAGTNHSRES